MVVKSKAKLEEELAQLLPKDDPRTKMLNASIKKANGDPSALIQILHTGQNLFGYLPENVVKYISKSMMLPPSRVYGVITFYHYFSLKQKGDHTCLICTGTACYVKGAQDLINKMKDVFNIEPGEVTPDNKLGLQVARCFGACGLAPAAIIDEEVFAKVNPDEIQGHIEAKMGDA